MSQQASFNPPLRVKMSDGLVHFLYAVDGKEYLTQAEDQRASSPPQWHSDRSVKEILEKPKEQTK